MSEMIKTDFKLRYQGSVLGYVWSLLKPLMLFAIMYTVFTQFLKIGKGIPNYAVSLLLGLVLWNFFNEATSSALTSIVDRGSLIRKINIPRYLIPISSIASAFINMLFNLIVVFAFAIPAHNKPISFITPVEVPLLLIELIVMTVSVSFFLSALYVKYRDIEHIWDVFKQALFYLSVIIFPLSKVSSVKIQKLLLLNPVAQIVQDARSVLTYGETPTLNGLYANRFVMAVPLGLIALALIVGGLYFKKTSKFFAEEV